MDYNAVQVDVSYEEEFWDTPTPIEEANMYHRTETENQRHHLRDRLHGVYHDKKTDLRRHFHLDDDPSPKTPQELVDRIKAGQYVLLKNHEGWESWMGPYSGIRWRKPDVVEDLEGYLASEAVLDVARVQAKDGLIVLPVEEGLKTLREFEAKTFN